VSLSANWLTIGNRRQLCAVTVEFVLNGKVIRFIEPKKISKRDSQFEPARTYFDEMSIEDGSN
jgi:hypothetical protein